jgi:RNA polymerase sigma factor (sigma-70 family)
MKFPDEKAMISGIRSHDSEILTHIYLTYFPMIEGFVIHHKGTRDQAKDVFQEAMIVVYNRIRSGDLELHCKFGTYLYAVCKKIWIQERKKYLLHQDKLKQQPMAVHEPGPEEDPLLRHHLTRIFRNHFSQLSPDCQKILSMYFNDYSLEDIRKELNYNTLHHTADRKYRCKKSLIKRILNDPLFKRLKNEQR